MLSIFLAPVSGNFKKQNALAQTTDPDAWWFQWSVPVVGTSGFKDFTGGTSDENKASCEQAATAWTTDDPSNSATPGNISIPCKQGLKPLINTGLGQVDPNKEDTSYMTCGIGGIGGTVVGCVVQFFYIIWEVSAKIARAAGHFLDFFVYYSLDDQSYRSSFIDKGWGAIRDVANIFFIISLIYVAIKTILSLNVHNNKKMVGMIIVMALIINFSLFTTKIVIDASNILAKIFYNNITTVDENGAPLPDNSQGKSISVGVVDKFKPQTILTRNLYDASAGLYLFMILVLISLTLYMAYMFFSVGVLFVGRVVSLWVAMIFSPVAFMSKAVEWDLGSLGFGKWWDNLIKNAMMAPIFVFFLYLIVLFLDIIGTGLTFTSTDTTMQMVMNTVIPFAILFVLIMKAKDLAIEYSGEIGKSLSKVGSSIAGLAVGGAIGAATGGVAMLGSKVIGGGAAKLMASQGENLKEAAKKKGLSGYAAKMALKSIDYGQKATFDARQTKLGSKLSSMTGLDFNSSKMIGLGTKEGGFKGAVERDAKKLEEEKELLKSTMSDAQVTEWSKKRVVQYQKDRENALDKDAFDKAHKPPKEYTKVDDLNKDRMAAFKDKLGQTDLLGSLAHSAASRMVGMVDDKSFVGSGIYKKLHKESEETKARLKAAEKDEEFNKDDFERTYTLSYDEDVAKKANNKITSYTKLGIGAAASLATGGALGGLVGAPIAGTILGGTGALGESMVNSSAEAKVAKAMEADTKKYDAINARINEVRDIIGKQGQIAKKASLSDVTKDIITIKEDVNGNITIDNIDEEKLSEAINSNVVEDIDLKNQLNKAKTEAERNRIKGLLIENTKKGGILNSIKGLDEKMAASQRQLFELNGKKGDMAKPPAKEEKPHAPAAPAATAAPAPAAHPPAPAPSSGGGGSHGGGGGHH